MKVSNASLLALLLVVGSLGFAMKNIQKVSGPETPKVPVPDLKPQTQSPKLRLKVLSSVDAGSYGRLSLDQYLTQNRLEDDIVTETPKAVVQNTPFVNSSPKHPETQTHNWTSLEATPSIPLNNLEITTAESVQLNYLPDFSENRWVDHVVDMAEASPLQPDSRGCGSLNYNVKSAPKYSKIRSVGMERQLTDRTSIGVEYVYKDGCYKKAIKPLNALNIPGDDGVNLRVNMKF